MPFAGHEQFLKSASGELVAHAADIVGGGPVGRFLLGDLLILAGQQFRLGYQPIVQF